MSDNLDKDLAAYERMRPDLEAHSMGLWVLVYNSELIGTYDAFENAAKEAVAKFGRGPYLIRQVGAPPVTLPASAMYVPSHR